MLSETDPQVNLSGASITQEIDGVLQQIRSVASDVCLGDLRCFGTRVTCVSADTRLSAALVQMSDEGSSTLCVCDCERERGTVVPLGRIEQEMATPFGQAIYRERSVAHFLETTGFECMRFSHELTVGGASLRAISRDEAERNDPVLVMEAVSQDDWVISVQMLLLVQSGLLRCVLEENEVRRAEVSEAQRAGAALQTELGIASRKAALNEYSTRSVQLIGSAFGDLRRVLGASMTGMNGDTAAAVEASARVVDEALHRALNAPDDLMIVEALSCSMLWREALLVEQEHLDRLGIEVVERIGACPRIMSDHRLVLRSLVSLLTNAKESIEACGSAERRIELSIESVIQSGVEGVRFSLRDTGAGIRADHLGRIFGEGFTTKAHAQGFGLVDASSTIERLGGAIWAESEGVGHGACFHVFLPLKSVEEQRSWRAA